MECPLHFSVRIQHNGNTVLLAAEELCVSFSEAVWRTFSLQMLVWWSQANAGSSGRQLFLNPLWSLMLIQSVWVLLELHCLFCPVYVWSLDEKVRSCVNRVKTYSQTYSDIVPVVFDIWLVMLLLQETTAQLDRFRSVLCQTYFIWDFPFVAIGI